MNESQTHTWRCPECQYQIRSLAEDIETTCPCCGYGEEAAIIVCKWCGAEGFIDEAECLMCGKEMSHA